MKKYKAAAILMIVHGGIIELGGFLSLALASILQNDALDIGQHFSFIIPYFQENLSIMLIIGAIFGAMRLIGGIGLLRNRMWGLALSVTNCMVTMVLAIFMLPAGITDCTLSCSALVLMIVQYFGKSKIIE